MKKSLLLFSILFSFLVALAQPRTMQADTWKIKWNKKILLETAKENELVNSKNLKRTELNKKYLLEITYKESDIKKEKEWKRSFLFFDENDSELLRKNDTRKVSITAAELKKTFTGKKQIRIYTIALPADPNMAASVRVRRVHLCTLVLQ